MHITMFTRERAFNSTCQRNMRPNKLTVVIMTVVMTINDVHKSNPRRTKVTRKMEEAQMDKLKTELYSMSRYCS